MDNRRRERLRNNTNAQKLNNPQVVNDLESEPAYLRRGVNLEDVPNSAEPALSQWTISDDDEGELRLGNSFLHDNVD
jgi:cell division protein FtsZ